MKIVSDNGVIHAFTFYKIYISTKTIEMYVCKRTKNLIPETEKTKVFRDAHTLVRRRLKSQYTRSDQVQKS